MRNGFVRCNVRIHLDDVYLRLDTVKHLCCRQRTLEKVRLMLKFVLIASLSFLATLLMGFETVLVCIGVWVIAVALDYFLYRYKKTDTRK